MMVTVDSSVWIDFFHKRETAPTQDLVSLLNDSTNEIVLLDVVLLELLRGVRSDKEHLETYQALLPITVKTAGGKDIALAAASMYRHIRRKGQTIRSSIDLLIAAWCITHECDLLHSDQDFDTIASHYPLRLWNQP